MDRTEQGTITVDLDYTKPIRSFNKHVSSRPLLHSAVTGAGLGAAGYHGTDLAARAFLGMSLIGKDTPEKEAAWERLKASGRLKKLKIIAGVLGAGAGVAYPLINSYSSKHSFMDNIKKSLNKDKFYANNPEAWKRERDDALANPDPLNATYSPDRGATFDSGRTNYFPGNRFNKLEKISSLDHFLSENVPIRAAQNVIHRDPFLTMGQKATVNGIIGGTADGDTGLTSGEKLADSAIKVGFGAAAGFAFGKTLGTLFAFDEPEVRRMSQYGTVAGALFNSGILNKELQ
jgi:hypothetical protein